MMEFGNYTDSFVLAVFFNHFESVKKILKSEKYNPAVLNDITNSLFGVPIPIYYISRCWEICLDHEFSESFNPIAQKNHENAKKILDLLKVKLVITNIEIPFSKILPACWNFEDDKDEDILEMPKDFLIGQGKIEIDLDLYIAVHKMDFHKVKELLENGANPFYKHYDDDSTLIDLCSYECSYQATSMAGQFIVDPDWWRNSVGYDELGELLRWAANEQMYQLLISQQNCY